MGYTGYWIILLIFLGIYWISIWTPARFESNLMGSIILTLFGVIVTLVLHFFFRWSWFWCLQIILILYLFDKIMGQVMSLRKIPLKYFPYPLLLCQIILCIISLFFFLYIWDSGWSLTLINTAAFIFFIPAFLMTVMNRLGLLWIPEDPDAHLKHSLDADTLSPIIEEEINKLKRGLVYLNECGEFTAAKLARALTISGMTDKTESELIEKYKDKFQYRIEDGVEKLRTDIKEILLKELAKWEARLTKK